MSTTAKNVSDFIVTGPDGSVDKVATMAKFEDALLEHLESREEMDDRILESIDAVFESVGGKRISKEALVASTLAALKADLSSYKTVKLQVERVIKEHSSEKGEDGKPKYPGKVLNVTRGSGGGIQRWVDTLKSLESKTSQK